MAKILLVEDNELNRDMLGRRLRRRGYDVTIAVDGAEAIAIASAQLFDLILMDMSLPVIDGWEATRRLKAQAHTQAVPIIALTAHAMRGDRDQALAAGCDDYDTKPIDLKRLLEKIKLFLSSERPATVAHRSPDPATLETLIAPTVSTAPVTPILPAVADTPAAATIVPMTPVTPITPVTPDAPAIPAAPVAPAASITPIVPATPTTAATSEPPALPKSKKSGKAFSGLSILVVDDNEDNRDMLSRRLNRRGYESVVVDSGEAALDYVENNHNVGLVLLDIMMPGIDGIETLRRIRQTYSRQQMPVLMVTAKAQSDDMVKAFELGANDYITKPIDFAVTLARVETQLSIVKAMEPAKSPAVQPQQPAVSQTVAQSEPQLIKQSPELHRQPVSQAAASPQPAPANIALVPKTAFSRFAAERYQVQYFLRQEPLGPVSIAVDKQTSSLVLLQSLRAHSPATADLLKRVMEKETERFQPLRSLFPGYTYGQVDNTFYVVHGVGESFDQDQLLQAKLQIAWPLESALLLMDRLLEQVGHFHRHRQVHAGLRDDSFIQTGGWETLGQSLVLVDSGLGKRVMIGVSQQSAEYRKHLLMQRDYQPLEQRIGRPAMSSDIYALGLIGLQALTGKSVDQLTLPTVSGDLQWRQFVAVPDPIGDWFEQLIHQNQSKRFEHAMAARTALRPHLQPYLAEPG
ncbi:MAG: response regulator [Cyanobacteria bacterium P01_A01_bin.15]